MHSTGGIAARARAVMLTAVLALAAAGCGARANAPFAGARADSGAVGPAGAAAARAQALIDSGNAAYRTADYGLAARRYAAAAVVKNDDPAAYFGLGMALAKLGRDDEARAAYAHSRALSRRQSAP